MPTLRSKYRYTKVYRPTGTRYAEAEVTTDATLRRVPGRWVVSISGVAEAARQAVDRALSDYMIEFHAFDGIPSEAVTRNTMVIEVVVGYRGVSATVHVLPEED